VLDTAIALGARLASIDRALAATERGQEKVRKFGAPGPGPGLRGRHRAAPRPPRWAAPSRIRGLPAGHLRPLPRL